MVANPDPSPRDICGTYSGAQQHRRRGERPCEDCLRAAADYIRDYRQHKGGADREARRTKARARALTRLAHLNPTIYGALLAEEMRREGAA